MELVKNIYFNTDKLVENTDVKISYTGKLYQKNNGKVFIHYGYGENWKNVIEIEMVKTDLGYQAELHLTNDNTINFCFKSDNNEWDNNFGKNYIFNIEKCSTNSNEKSASFYNKEFAIPNAVESQLNSEQPFTNKITLDNTTPESADAFISNSGNIINPVAPNNIENACQIGNEIQPTMHLGDIIPPEAFGLSNSDFVSKPSLDTIENVAPTASNTILNQDTIKIVIPQIGFEQKNNAEVVSANQNNTALTVYDSSMRWTQKVKKTLAKIFSYVPKFISGNYKRKLKESKK